MIPFDDWLTEIRCKLCTTKVTAHAPDRATAEALVAVKAHEAGFLDLPATAQTVRRLHLTSICKECAAEVTAAYLNAGRSRQVVPDRGTLLRAVASAIGIREQAEREVVAAKTPVALEAARGALAVAEADEQAARAALAACEVKLAGFRGPPP